MILRAAPVAVAALLCAACMGGADDEPRAAGGQYLVYTRALDLPEQAIWIGDVEGRRMRRLTRGSFGLVSPDGRTIAVSRRSAIHTLGPDARGERLVARGKPALWLSDSRHLLAIQGKALVNIDVEDDSVAVIARNDPVTWSISPDGKAVAYELYERTSGPCEGRSDIYVADADGGSRKRLTKDGRSSRPVWGKEWIAFAHRPAGADCFVPRIWKMRPDGRSATPIMRTLPKRFANSGFYGVRPHAWVAGRPLIVATSPTEWGLVLAIVNTQNGSVRMPDLDPRPRTVTQMYVDDVSRDGRHVVGAACGAEFPCTIRTYSVEDGRASELATGRVAYPDWNR